MIVIFRDITGSVFANLHDFKNLAGIYHFTNTKALGNFELKCLMSSAFLQRSSKSFLRSYQFLQKNPSGEVSLI